MSQTDESLVFTADDYLDWEERQDSKHEYVNGVAVAMSDVLREHVPVTGNIAVALKLNLCGTPCQTYISAMKLRVEQQDAFY